MNKVQRVRRAFPGQVLQAAGAEIIKHTNGGSLAAQGLGKMGTDESGAAGDEGFHMGG
jgi:hypothetical protein